MSTLFSVEECMKRKEQSELIDMIKEEINSRLVGLDIYKVRDLVLWMLQNPEYQKVKIKDEQLMRLDLFADIWRQEKSDLHAFEMQGDIFAGVTSLDELDKKYQYAKFAIWRIENKVPYEYLVKGVEGLEQYRYSAYAIYRILMMESKKRKDNILDLARLLKEREQNVKAIGLLQLGVKKYPGNADMAVELADLWLTEGQLKKAYDCLVEIEKPTNEIQELIRELEKLIKNEAI